MIIGDYLIANSEAYKPSRVVSNMATGFRMAQYPDGTQKIQGAYQWTEGFQVGYEWKDLPIVEVNIHGQVPNDD